MLPALPEPPLSLSVFGALGVLRVPALQPQGFAGGTPLKMLRVPSCSRVPYGKG